MKNKGFTIIELMVVIIIMGVMAGLSVPAITGSLPNYRLNNDIRNVTNSLILARSFSITNGTPYLCTFTQNASFYTIVKDLNANHVVDAGEPTNTVQLSRNISISSATVTIIFSPRGNADVSGNVSLINSKNITRTVFVPLSGTVILP